MPARGKGFKVSVQLHELLSKELACHCPHALVLGLGLKVVALAALKLLSEVRSGLPFLSHIIQRLDAALSDHCVDVEVVSNRGESGAGAKGVARTDLA